MKRILKLFLLVGIIALIPLIGYAQVGGNIGNFSPFKRDGNQIQFTNSSWELFSQSTRGAKAWLQALDVVDLAATNVAIGGVVVGSLDLNGNEFILDADGDTSLQADTDDQIDVKINNADDFRFGANEFIALSGSSIRTATISSLSGGKTITLSGIGGATNNENLIFNFEDVGNTVGITSGTGVTTLDASTIDIKALNGYLGTLYSQVASDIDHFVLRHATGANWLLSRVGADDMRFTVNSAVTRGYRVDNLGAGEVLMSVGDGTANKITTGLYSTRGFETDAMLYADAGATIVGDVAATTHQGITLASGANTFSAGVGTASLDIAPGATLNVDANLTVETASLINQDLTSDASPTFVGLNLSGTITGVTTAITGTKNNGLIISVPNQGISDANGVGIVIQADDAGSGGGGNHNGGNVVLDVGAGIGLGEPGKIVIQNGATEWGYIVQSGVASKTPALIGLDTDSATAIGTILGAHNNFTTTGSRLVSFRSNFLGVPGGLEKSYIGLNGGLWGAIGNQLNIRQTDQLAGGLAGTGILIQADAAGTGGTGHNRGGHVWLAGGEEGGTTANDGYVAIAPVNTYATNYDSIMTPYSVWIYGYLEVNNASQFNSSVTFGSGFTSTITTVPTVMGSSGLYGGGQSTKAGKTVQTTDATVTDIDTIAVVEKDVWQVNTEIVATKTDGTDRAVYNLLGFFYRNVAGNVTQQGATVVIGGIESDATWNADLVADTVNQTIDVRVTGKAATTVRWKATTKYQRVVLP